jgi:hypothetical protein
LHVDAPGLRHDRNRQDMLEHAPLAHPLDQVRPTSPAEHDHAAKAQSRPLVTIFPALYRPRVSEQLAVARMGLRWTELCIWIA